MSRLFLFLSCALWCGVSISQEQLPATKFLSLSCDNDLFYWFGYSTDRYYTAGNSLTYGLLTKANKKAVNVLLPTLFKDSPSVFTFRLFQQLNTPTWLSRPTIDTTDYPYASALYLTASRNSLSSSGKTRWKTEWSVGVIGPSSLGREMQSFLHSFVRSTSPQGWQYQVPDQLIINYHLDYERVLISAGKNKHVAGFGQFAAGSLSTYAQTGVSVNFYNKKQLSTDVVFWPTETRWTIMGSIAGSIRLVGWNGMLQGSPLNNKESYYHIATSSITRWLPFFYLKIAVGKGPHTFQASQTFSGKEFTTVESLFFGTLTYSLRLVN